METNKYGFAVDSDGLDFFDHRYGRFGEDRVLAERAVELKNLARLAERRKCVGGECKDIYQLCSKHSMAYQMHHGRAANE
jgi:hypothetical protein